MPSAQKLPAPTSSTTRSKGNTQSLSRVKSKGKPEGQSAGRKVDHSKRAHARRPPSSLKYRELCPGWRKKNDRRFEVYSNEGTAMHEAVEKGTSDKLDEHAMIQAIHAHKIGRMIGEQKDCVDRILRYLAPIEATAKKIEREVRMPIAPEYGVDFGTVDFLATQKDESVDMSDYKFGKHLVDRAEYNAQFAIGYVIGLFRNRPKVNLIRVHLLQPRVREEADVAEFKREDLRKLELRLAVIISKEEYGNPAEYNPTYEGCIYCGRIALCPKVAMFATRVAKSRDEYPPLLLDKMPLTVEKCKNDPEVIAALKDMAKVMEEWKSEVDQHALDWSLTQGIDLPGYTMAERRGGRFLQSALLAWEEIKSIKGLDKKPLMTQDEFLTTVARIDFDAFDKLISSRYPRGEKGKAVEAVAKQLAAEGVLQRYPGSKYLRRLRRGE